jgi:enterochelin esterase family protein
MEVFNLVLNGPQKDIDWYLDWGTYEPGIMINARAMRDGLISKDYDITWNEWHEGHSWGSWRAHLDIALKYFFPITSDVKKEEIVPREFVLAQNFPNPFNPNTKIRYSIPHQSDVLIKVYDILGREVETLLSEEKPSGIYEITWYAENLPSGVYFYQIKAGDFVETKKMVLMK